MSADFWAGYLSGAIGIVIGNPLDVLKVRLQARNAAPTASPLTPSPLTTSATAASTSAAAASQIRPFHNITALAAGTAAPILGYGALNALLFVSYNRTEAALDSLVSQPNTPASSNGSDPSLLTTWIAGAVGGLATWAVSTPTELIKCRAQLASPPRSSWAITKEVLRNEGVRGLYFGGVVTALRDSIGYGFYFWTYELMTRSMAASAAGGGQAGVAEDPPSSSGHEAAKVLLCGGLAGVATWVSVFPLDVIKTRVQTQAFAAAATEGAALPRTEASPLLSGERAGGGLSARGNISSGGLGVQSIGDAAAPQKRMGAVEVAAQAYREAGVRVFFRGLTVCSVRAFVVNAVQWAVYEWVMSELGQGKKRAASATEVQ